jgi:predicted MFS family arabinose efflux permease
VRTLPRGATSTPTTRPPGLVYVIAAGIFLMGTTEFMIAGLLPEAAAYR